MSGSALIVNNRVILASDASHAAIGGARLPYIASRPGAVSLPTEDDMRIERENALMAKLGYVGFRPGSVPEPNSGHALFDASGVPIRARVQQDLLATNSAIITSVLSVRREDTEAMRLTTKQDWERFVRSQWPRYIERMDIISPENLRWVAAMHICDHSYHVHIFTWDKSGCFDSLLPRQKMIQADNAIRHAALKPLREEPNQVRKLARDELVAGVREAIAENKDLREMVKHVIPEFGSLKYAIVTKRNPYAKQVVDAAVGEVLARDSALAAKHDAYLAAAREHAKLRELTGSAFDAHMTAAENELRVRLGNAAIAAVRPKLVGGTVVSRPKPPITNGEYAPPIERRRICAMAEEASSFLSSSEQRQLKKQLLSCAHGSIPNVETIRLSKKLPALRVRAKTSGMSFNSSFQTSVIDNGRRLARTLIGAEKGHRDNDFGNEMGQRSILVVGKGLGRALSVIAYGMPIAKQSQMSEIIASNTVANTFQEG